MPSSDKISYSNWTAMIAILKASLKATFKSPQTIFFSLFFPVILISIFGSFGGKSGSVEISLMNHSDTNNIVYQNLSQQPLLKIYRYDSATALSLLKKGTIAALIDIQPIHQAPFLYQISLTTSAANPKDLPLLKLIVENVQEKVNLSKDSTAKNLVMLTQTQLAGRVFTVIDFLLPGMIGFSLIGVAVFGVAFSFYSFRETLVLKRMYASPIKKGYIVLGESLARVIFQLITVAFLILYGKLMYNFTLADRFYTFIDMLIVSMFGLLVFMGVGFLISSIAKNQSVIPIYANIFMFPQYFLSGTFFSISVLPKGLQSFVQYLPLTAVNEAMRNIAFDGLSIWACWPQLLVLSVWGLVVYAITFKVFKWE